MICPKCKQEVYELTRDHLIPRWLLINLPLLGFTRKRQKQIQASNINMICKECNLWKGGYPDYDNRLVRKVMREISDNILNELKEYKD